MQSLDKIIIGSFILFFVSAISLEYINAVTPVNERITNEKTSKWIWPPSFILKLYYSWCENVDPILLNNDYLMKYFCCFSLLILAPFYLIGIYAIYNKKQWIRVPMIICAFILFFGSNYVFYQEGLTINFEHKLKQRKSDLVTIEISVYNYTKLIDILDDLVKDKELKDHDKSLLLLVKKENQRLLVYIPNTTNFKNNQISFDCEIDDNVIQSILEFKYIVDKRTVICDSILFHKIHIEEEKIIIK
ncbi:unnamed protein product [Adineta steineri]|uniref:EXPERA domain-containing protein n=1 Tax=Adineta steineri TaxID=433720 RepID=A0A819Y307_9BILA|nr:unnamed protein product [Adineta steineri]